MYKADNNRDDIDKPETEEVAVKSETRRSDKKVNKAQRNKKLIFIILAILLVAALVAFAIYKANQSRDAAQQENPAVAELKRRLPELKKNVDGKPNDASARYNLGSAYYGTDDKEAAAREYQEAIKIDPKNPAYYNNLGNTYRDLKKYDEAIDAYKKAIELQPKHPNAYSNLAFVYENSKKDTKAAIDTYDKAANAMEGPEKVSMLTMKAMMQARAGDKQAARGTYEEVLRLDPENAVAKANLEQLK